MSGPAGLPLAEFLVQDALTVAPLLLGAELTSSFDGGSGRSAPVTVRITEVEAYLGEEDPGSHAFRGPTPRTQVMFGPAGYFYCYFVYGMHWSGNIICSPAGTASAVLLRAGEIIRGVELARSRRPATKRDADLASGPARLAAALGLARAADGVRIHDLAADPSSVEAAAAPGLGLRRNALAAAETISSGLRVGVSGAGGTEQFPWRFWISGNPSVSKYKAAVPRKRSGAPQSGA
ncbi:DNA-3-methyladenine glycosylase [Arthrobacter russicus]|uniref:Putative 3-methyladenine DNA glycosylase n=1 Tax=Arthrobacter russicus TaxID=172040 RepID=A0ABU1JEH4_9MICC|nr:DNA-3-methyladenine glycosylase [Arthrobacter russicus]MDR6270852.1 DNA-3-methyladenine glycosylase [Arthrobacter russicus]